MILMPLYTLEASACAEASVSRVIAESLHDEIYSGPQAASELA